jgi:predicted small lipoprotein YifL
MRLKLSALSPLLCLVVVLQLSACGNKGDLFLVPDEITQQDLLRLEQALEVENVQTDVTDTSKEDDDIDEVKKDKTPDTPSS